MEERRRQLRREMDHYLTGRRKLEGGGSWFSQKTQPQPDLHPTIHSYKTKEQAKESEKPEQSPMEADYETGKKGWISGFVGKLFGAEGEVTSEDVNAQLAPGHEETMEDLKEVARISLHVMRQMPGDAIAEFKETSDYERFKDILRKHKLIK